MRNQISIRRKNLCVKKVIKLFHDEHSCGSFTPHGTGNGAGNGTETHNDGFLYYTMYFTHYTGSGTESGNNCFQLFSIVPISVSFLVVV